MSKTLNRVLALAVVLASQAAFAQFSVAAMAERATFTGSLTAPEAAPRYTAHLSGVLRLAQGEYSPVGSMTREQLQAEYAALDATRPSLAGKIALLATGGALSLVGLYPLIFGLFTFAANAAAGTAATAAASATFNVVGAVLVTIGAALIATGVVLIVVGVIRLTATLEERRRIGKRMDELQMQIDTLDANESSPAPPPSTVFLPVRAGWVVARF